MISIGSKELKVIKPAAIVVQFWNEKSTTKRSYWRFWPTAKNM